MAASSRMRSPRSTLTSPGLDLRPSTFESALVERPLADQTKIQQLLNLVANSSAVGYQAVLNLRNETRIPLRDWRELAEALRATSFDAGSVRETIANVLRKWQLLGPPIQTNSKQFGRAISVEKFARLLFALHYFPDVVSSRQSVRSAAKAPLRFEALVGGLCPWKILDLEHI